MSLSIDATLKICMTVQGQASYRSSAAVRNAACFGDGEALRRVLTIRGRSGAVVLMVPVPSEDAQTIATVMAEQLSPTALAQVKYIATDSPSNKLFCELRVVCPNLISLSLDPVHLAIVYEYAQWGKRTSGSRILRQLVNKINQVESDLSLASFGPFFQGHSPPSLSRQEERLRNQIMDASMGELRAKRVIQNLDPSKPLYCRVTFIEVLAAIVKLHPTEVDRKVTGTAKEVRKVLWAAAAPDRMEWLLNGSRMRHAMDAETRALLPSGTSSNEALHAELNSWMKSIRSLHQSTLKLKLHIIQFGKLLAHHVAACFPASRQTSESILLARAVATRLWSTEAWAEFCAVQCKASLPLHNSRKKEAEEVKAWRDSQPASHRVLKTVRKRTVHTVPRRRSFKSKRDVQRA